MNKLLQNFARNYLKTGLAQLPFEQQNLFHRMYGHKKPGETLDNIVDEMSPERLDWAMEQVERTLMKYQQVVTVKFTPASFEIERINASNT